MRVDRTRLNLTTNGLRVDRENLTSSTYALANEWGARPKEWQQSEEGVAAGEHLRHMSNGVRQLAEAIDSFQGALNT